MRHLRQCAIYTHSHTSSHLAPHPLHVCHMPHGKVTFTVQGFARLLSGMLPEHHNSVSPFPNSKYLFRIEFQYLGEYSKRMFMNMLKRVGPSPIVDFVDGTVFPFVCLPFCLLASRSSTDLPVSYLHVSQ